MIIALKFFKIESDEFNIDEKCIRDVNKILISYWSQIVKKKFSIYRVDSWTQNMKRKKLKSENDWSKKEIEEKRKKKISVTS